MREILESLVETWQGPIVVGWLVVMFAIISFGGRKDILPEAVPAKISKRFGIYGVFVIFGSYYEVSYGFHILENLLHYYQDVPFVGAAAFAISIIYAVSFFYALILLLKSKPIGLVLARIYSLSFPLLIIAFSLLCFFVADVFTGKSISWEIYSQSSSISISIFVSLVFVPWFLYFSFSSELKEICGKLNENSAER